MTQLHVPGKIIGRTACQAGKPCLFQTDNALQSSVERSVASNNNQMTPGAFSCGKLLHRTYCLLFIFGKMYSVRNLLLFQKALCLFPFAQACTT